jgi:hypothetical protein
MHIHQSKERRVNLDQHTDIAQRVAVGLTYTVSGGLMVGDALQWLNNNAGAVGAIMAMLTFGVNWYYQRKRNREK